ncbi:polysaccharide deacetylase family protein [Actinacidiphila acididurans]|uniref:Polysaccharide deacetylase family protein n=1 Tax=Actinacidiphila acididurans TaxID=2784346 RepID=A0ABS2U276_9ACTN|nr:polysaccharide deacetylase family protein [Actinacidiphila acididurans]MBM9508625.1 polysaccharide deacetylase family protein [Actinacidiphila acididurans]
MTTAAGGAAADASGGTGLGSGGARVLDRTRHEGRRLALTFDDGPNPVDTPRLLAVLREHRVPAVFFLWGDHVRAHPEIVRAIVADGHTLGNHSMQHDDMSDWPAERIRADLAATNEVIRAAVPDVPIPYFRAPYGGWGRSPQVAAELGMRSLGWQLAVTDWEPPGTPELVRRLAEGARPGAVVLLHDGGGDRSQTVAAVERFVPDFAARGWSFDEPERG